MPLRNPRVPTPRALTPLLVLWGALATTSCQATHPTDRSAGPSDSGPTSTSDAGPLDTGTQPLAPIVSDPLHGLPTGVDQWNVLCAKGHQDTVSRRFCAEGVPPSIGSLAELRSFVGLGGDEIGGASPLRVTATFHSTAVSGRFVTPLNPRVFFMPAARGRVNPNEPQPDPDYVILAFSRGERFVELVSKDLESLQPRFFLLRFELPCEATRAGCSLADLLTPTIETGWTGYSLYDDESVANTTLDCLRCHQPEGPGTATRLLMQELRNPWNHWFYEEHPQNIGAIEAFEAAHGTTRYGDLPANLYTRSRPSNLQALVQNNSLRDQPNEYDSLAINEELAEHGTSPTWDALFAQSLVAQHKPVPFAGNPQVDGHWDYSEPFAPVLDPTSPVAAMIEAYRDTVTGAVPRDRMPDIRDIWLPEALAAMSYRPAPGLDGAGIMGQICRQCHNARLDPTLTRARFDVDALDTLSREEKDEAIARLLLSDADARKMPPARFTELTDTERDLVIGELSR